MSTKTKIEAIFTKMAEAFAEKNIEKYMSLYAENSELVIYGSQVGEKWIDLDEFQKSTKKNWEHTDKVTVVYDWMKINYQDDVGWIASDIRFDVAIGENIMSISGRLTAVLINKQNKWKIVQSHFSMAMPSQ